MKKSVILLLVLCSVAIASYGNPPRYEGGWQWNDNVKIDFIYTYWNDDVVHFRMDNGDYCYFNPSEKAMLATVLAARTQQATVSIVCQEATTQSVEGVPSRHVHRIRF